MNFHSIGIVGKDGEKTLSTLKILIDYLKQKKLLVFLEATTAQNLDAPSTAALSMDELAQRCDLLIVVGGDGTLLGTARVAAHHNTPVVGINLGRLGFLVDISPSEMLTSLNQIFTGNYEEDARLLLEVSTSPAATPVLAMNDIVIHKWNTARLIEFETFIDGQFVDTQRSDGLIVTTPTGSTAYALSGGGPLLHPGLKALALVPICPHTLSNRPIVVESGSEIEIRVCGLTKAEHVRVTPDGQTSLEVESGQPICIKRHKNDVRLLHLPHHDHFHILRAKLGWGKHHASQ